MTEPDYTRYTLEELEDTLARIDAARFPTRAARLRKEIELRALYPDQYKLLQDERQLAHIRRNRAYTRAVLRWGAAGAISLPCSLALLNAMTGIFSNTGGDFESVLVYGSYFGGWFAGSVTGLINESLRERREGIKLPGATREALGALVISMMFAGFVVPLGFIFLMIGLGLLSAIFFGAIGALS
jgi:hypothetical protein